VPNSRTPGLESGFIRFAPEFSLQLFDPAFKLGHDSFESRAALTG